MDMEEVRLSDWPEPPGSHAWLPAYGFQHDIMDKDDYFGSTGEFVYKPSGLKLITALLIVYVAKFVNVGWLKHARNAFVVVLHCMFQVVIPC